MKTLIVAALMLFASVSILDAQWADGGRTQSAPNLGNGPLFFHNGTMLYFNEENTFQKSTDFGATWIDTPDSTIPGRGGLAKTWAAMTAAGGRIYSAVSMGGNGTPLYTTNDGDTWIPDTLGAPGHALGWGGLPAIHEICAWGHWVFVNWDGPNMYDIKSFDGPFVRNPYMVEGIQNPRNVVGKGDTLFVSSTKLYYSVDGGANWIVAASNGYPGAGYIFLDGNRLCLLSKVWPGPYNFYYSDDNGENWTKVDITAVTGHKIINGDFATPSAYFVKGNLFWLAQGQEHLASPPNVFKSTNLGVTWTPDSVGMYSSYIADIRNFTYTPDGYLWAVQDHYKIYKQKIDGGVVGPIVVTDAPQLTLPLDVAVLSTTSATMRWMSVSNASKYHLQVAHDATFTGLVYNDATLTDTVKTITGLSDGSFYWRVAGLTSDDKEGPWSASRSFSVQTASVARQTEGIVTLGPNPAQDNLSISAYPGIKSFELFDMLGRSQKSVAPVAPSHQLTVDIKSIPSGSYTAVLTMATGERVVRKIVKSER